MSTPNRNDPCPCGSGKRYKQCCGSLAESKAAQAHTVDTPISNILQAALEHHQSGRFPQAEALYRQILQVAPNHSDALHFLGVLAHQVGKSDIAVELISKAIRANPSNPMYYNNLGNALKDQGKLEEALESYQTVISLKPDSAEAHFNLGNALRDQGRLDAALESYHRAVSLKPNFADAYSNMGLALKGQGKLDAALESFHQALLLQPDHAEAYYDMGNVLQELGRLEAAVESYHQALSLQPNYADAHYNLGNAFQDQGKLDAAVESYQQALLLQPDHAEVHYNLGNVFRDQGRLDEAMASFHKALESKSDFTLAYSSLLFLHAYHGTLEPAAYLPLARGWEVACVPEQDREAARNRKFQRPPLAGRRLKIGYVSGDFRQHAVSYFIEQLFARHDRSRVELYAYSTAGARDGVTERLQAMVEHWLPVTGMSDTALRERIEADGIDVLIDLSGHTAHNRMGVFARRAAPVQVHYLGYFASTGLSEMDYFIGDAMLTPPETDQYFAEQVWRLPRIRASYDGKADAPLPDWRPDPAGAVWVGSFNDLGKLTPQTIALWAKVLHVLPQGKLLLKTRALADAGNRRRILDALAAEGISPDRIELQSGEITPGWKEHMAYYNRLDIALDPIGAHGGYTTTCDALWMGVPVITLEGDRMASRMTASILSAIGHAEWIAHSEAEYVDKVVALAGQVKQRQALRSDQRERMASSPLCDAKDLASKLEDAYFEMFGLWTQR